MKYFKEGWVCEQGCVLQVLTQSYFLPFGVKTLATTATSHGITQKFILMGTFTDQVGAHVPSS